jgi:hypothetical protein
MNELWAELVTTALLGTDRRDPALGPDGAIADLVADAVRHDPAERMLAAVAATAAARRAAFVALGPASALQPPEPDARPVITPAAAATWRTVIAEWPVLEDEWMLTVLGNGWRLAPDVLVDALARHPRDPVRQARVARAGGPLAAWTIDHIPDLVGAPRRTVSADAALALPELPVPPELAELLGADAHTFARSIQPIVDSATPAHRPVLVNLVARCRREVLPEAAEALAGRPFGLALALAGMCRLRHRMLIELSARR